MRSRARALVHERYLPPPGGYQAQLYRTQALGKTWRQAEQAPTTFVDWRSVPLELSCKSTCFRTIGLPKSGGVSTFEHTRAVITRAAIAANQTDHRERDTFPSRSIRVGHASEAAGAPARRLKKGFLTSSIRSATVRPCQRLV